MNRCTAGWLVECVKQRQVIGAERREDEALGNENWSYRHF